MRTGVAVVVLAIGMLAGCSGQGGGVDQGSGHDQGDTGQGSAPPPAARPSPQAPAPVPSPGGVQLDTSPTLEQIRTRGKLLVGLRADARRFAARDGAGGYRGFDVEIARRIAQGLGLDPATQVSFRMLPATLQSEALAGGSVDLQIGGVDPARQGVSAVGPYAVTDGGQQFVGLKSGDDVLRDQIDEALRTAVADGSWQRAYDATLAPEGVQATPG